MKEPRLKALCHINENGDGDRFVGVKVDGDEQRVFFPMGYRLPVEEDDIRNDILQLIDIISVFNESKDKVLSMQKFETPHSVNFPVNAYMNIIREYLENDCYYTEKEPVRKKSDRGRIDWPTSLKKNVAFYQEDGTPFFNDYTVTQSATNENNLITQIHKFCVYEAFLTLGWLFTPHLPPDPHIPRDIPRFIQLLNNKIASTFNTDDKKLFADMKGMLEYLDAEHDDKQYYFGTDRFEYVWEKLIDEIFGVAEKEDFFPRTNWTLKFTADKRNHALEPDSIMMHNNKIFVLDSKYYRYGVTGKPKHLPESTSINKQITYAEYIKGNDELKAKYGDIPIFNAFIMPFNKEYNPFDLNDQYFLNVGEATSEWKHDTYLYEKVQGIVVDIRFIMRNYHGSRTSKIKALATAIEEALATNTTFNN